MHPLRIAYVTMLHDEYGVLLRGDKNPIRTGAIADKVNALGLSYDMYMELAFGILKDSIDSRGDDAYPYWNMVTSDFVLGSVRKLIDITEEDQTSDVDSTFYAELHFALNYARWFQGLVDVKPRRIVIPDGKVKDAVMEYICTMYNVSYITSDYNKLAMQLEGRLG